VTVSPISKSPYLLTDVPAAEREGKDLEVAAKDEVPAEEREGKALVSGPVEQEEVAAAGQEEVAAVGQEEVAAVEQEEVAAVEQEEVTAEGQEEVAAVEQEEVTAEGQEEVAAVEQEEVTAEGQEEVAAVEQEEVAAVGQEAKVVATDASCSRKAAVEPPIRLSFSVTPAICILSSSISRFLSTGSVGTETLSRKPLRKSKNSSLPALVTWRIML